MKMEQSEFESMRVAIGRRDTGAIRQLLETGFVSRIPGHFRWEGTAILLYRSILQSYLFIIVM